MTTATSYELADVRDATIASLISYVPGLEPTRDFVTGDPVPDLQGAIDRNTDKLLAYFESQYFDPSVYNGPTGPNGKSVNRAAIDRFFQRYEIVGTTDTDSSDASVAARDAGVGAMLVFDKQENRCAIIVDGTENNPAKAVGNEPVNDVLADIYVAFGPGIIPNNPLDPSNIVLRARLHTHKQASPWGRTLIHFLQ